MEPQYSSPNTAPGFSPEQQPAPSIIAEQLPDVSASPEAPVVSPEKATSVEQLAVDHLGQTIVAAPVQPAPPTQVTDDSPLSTPAAAADNDNIEKEWVARAKQAISSTTNDPHAQQHEVSRMMAEYVLKRFGRKVGKVEE